jgi:Ca2+-binding EF-hand superfamily protein
MMTRKNFKALAEIVKGIKNDTERERTAKLMADFCSGQNGLFNRSKFLEA